MGARGRDGQAVAPGQPGELAAQADDLAAGHLDVLADGGPDLDHRLVHLRLQLVLEQLPAGFQKLLDVGAQVPRLQVDELELLFDPQREQPGFTHGIALMVRQRQRAEALTNSPHLRLFFPSDCF
jgi:hypothetical protein